MLSLRPTFEGKLVHNIDDYNAENGNERSDKSVDVSVTTAGSCGLSVSNNTLA